jgi:C4-dicarboxylate-specific signal transduction histidine kinase
LITADGSIRWVHLNLSLVRSMTGEPLEFVSIVQDVTGQVEAKESLQVAQDQLIRVSRLSAMGAMASTLAHELNQPLAAISNFSAAARNMLMKTDAADRASLADMMDRCAKQALRAGEVIRKMRDFTVSGQLDLRAESLDAIVMAARDTLHARRVYADVHVSLEQHDGPQSVLADRIQLEQVIGNLLLNAAEAMEGQSLRKISVSIRREGDMVTLAVQDDGPGVCPDMAATLFEPFRTTKVRGTGLGLPICRMIVEAHHGHIWLEQTKSHGALFKISLRSSEECEKAESTDRHCIAAA